MSQITKQERQTHAHQRPRILGDPVEVFAGDPILLKCKFYSVMRAIKALEECDVCLLMLDSREGMQNQDLSIFKLAKDRNKGVVIIANKWDLYPNKETNTTKEYEEKLRERLAPFSDVPIVFTSVLDKQRIFKVVEVALEVAENRRQKIKTSILNDFLENALAKVQPPSHRGHLIKIKYVTQLPLYYPAFAFFCNHPNHVKESYKQYLENQMREKFNFTGVPISLFFRDK